ncbi:FkbM family methyltransferase, partial [Streptomyces sp. TRM76130]|nr:FkbM family methyltransferase [Streptomyces sp. TRM76130]
VVRGLAPRLGALRPDAEVCVEVTPERMARLGDSAEDLMATFAAAGFHAYRMANGYTPADFLKALRTGPAAPVRWREPLVGETQLVFSRVDAETLP